MAGKGQTLISLLLLRWLGEWASDTEAAASGGTPEFMGGVLGGGGAGGVTKAEGDRGLESRVMGGDRDGWKE